MSSRPACSKELVTGQLGLLHRETLSQKTKEEEEEEKEEEEKEEKEVEREEEEEEEEEVETDILCFVVCLFFSRQGFFL